MLDPNTKADPQALVLTLLPTEWERASTKITPLRPSMNGMRKPSGARMLTARSVEGLRALHPLREILFLGVERRARVNRGDGAAFGGDHELPAILKACRDAGALTWHKGGAARVPGLRCEGSTRIPACEVPIPISSSAQIIPLLSTFLIFATFIVKGSPDDG